MQTKHPRIRMHSAHCNRSSLRIQTCIQCARTYGAQGSKYSGDRPIFFPGEDDCLGAENPTKRHANAYHLSTCMHISSS